MGDDCHVTKVGLRLKVPKGQRLFRLQAEGKSPQTLNHYLRAAKQFTKWLVTDRRATENALQHLGTSLVELFKPWLSQLLPNAKLWPGRWAELRRASKFIQLDLAAARANWLLTIPEQERESAERSDFLKYRDAEGRQIDFHALRHTFLSRLGRAGVSAKVMQRLARHSTVELTIGRYTHANAFDLAAGMNSLPTLPTNRKDNERQILRATGTDHHSAPGKSVLPSCLPETVAFSRRGMHRDAVTRPEKSNSGNDELAEKTRILQEKTTERGGFEPPIPFQVYRFSKPAHSATLPPLQKSDDSQRNRCFPLITISEFPGICPDLSRPSRIMVRR